MFTIIFNYSAIESFVYSKLNMAKQSPIEWADVFEAQAFGVIDFATRECYKVQPDLCDKITKMWENEWQKMFWDIRYQKEI